MAGFAEIAGRVVVITGASSGIGPAAALAFAKQGAVVVLAARNAEQLEDAARDCRAFGGKTLVVPTDVADAGAVSALAQAAVTAFGRIDVWINNAGVGVIGPFVDTPMELHRRTLEVDLLGAFHGAHAVLPRFVEQGEGILFNTISMAGWSPPPFAPAYSASKFGLRALTSTLRQEMFEHPRIHVCGVFPALVDTPGIASAASTSGKAINAGPYLYAAEDVAQVFVALVRRPARHSATGPLPLFARAIFSGSTMADFVTHDRSLVTLVTSRNVPGLAFETFWHQVRFQAVAMRSAMTGMMAQSVHLNASDDPERGGPTHN